MTFGDCLAVNCKRELQPAAAAMAEVWTVESERGSILGKLVFQVNAEAKAARVTSFELPDSDDASHGAIAEDLSRFVLAALGARISSFDVIVVLPMEVSPMIEVAEAAFSDALGDEEPVMCCDSDGWPIMPIPRAFAMQHRIWRLEGDGKIVVRS